MNIRRAVQEDRPQIETLLYQVHKVHSDKRPDLFIDGQKKYTTAELERLIEEDDRPIYVAEEDGRILGYAFCVYQQSGNHSLHHIRTLYIDDLCVLEGIRGKGIGRKLYEYVLEVARQNGCYNVTLNVWECNPGAKRFYEKCGLQIQKYGMEKILSQPGETNSGTDQ